VAAVFESRATVEGSHCPGSLVLARAVTLPPPPSVIFSLSRPVLAHRAICFRVSRAALSGVLRVPVGAGAALAPRPPAGGCCAPPQPTPWHGCELVVNTRSGPLDTPAALLATTR
jgi:hypothetical protein